MTEITQFVQPKQEFDIDGFLEKRKEFIEKVNSIMLEGKDFHLIQGKKSMAKGGAEKIASIFGWTATFEKDAETMEAFAGLKDVIAYTCNLTKNLVVVGQGRGASVLSKNNGDPNKTIKMAQKSAFIDAVIRTSGLSDFFTQDLGPDDEGSQYNHLGEKSSPRASNSSTEPIYDPTPECPKHKVKMAVSNFGGYYCREKDPEGKKGYCEYKTKEHAPHQENEIPF